MPDSVPPTSNTLSASPTLAEPSAAAPITRADKPDLVFDVTPGGLRVRVSQELALVPVRADETRWSTPTPSGEPMVIRLRLTHSPYLTPAVRDRVGLRIPPLPRRVVSCISHNVLSATASKQNFASTVVHP